MRRAQELISRQPYKVVLLTTTVVIVSITLVSIPGLVLVLVLVLLVLLLLFWGWFLGSTPGAKMGRTPLHLAGEFVRAAYRVS